MFHFSAPDHESCGDSSKRLRLSSSQVFLLQLSDFSDCTNIACGRALASHEEHVSLVDSSPFDTHTFSYCLSLPRWGFFRRGNIPHTFSLLKLCPLALSIFITDSIMFVKLSLGRLMKWAPKQYVRMSEESVWLISSRFSHYLLFQASTLDL